MNNMNSTLSSSFVSSLMDCKSKSTYDRWISRYEQYCVDKGTEITSFSTFMDWIQNLALTYTVSTIWQAASCTNKLLSLKHNTRFIQEPVFKSYMKKLAKSYALFQCLGRVNCSILVLLITALFILTSNLFYICLCLIHVLFSE